MSDTSTPIEARDLFNAARHAEIVIEKELGKLLAMADGLAQDIRLEITREHLKRHGERTPKITNLSVKIVVEI